MVDEEIQGVAPGAAGAPVNRDARPDPGVIEGEVAAGGAQEDRPPDATPAHPPSAPTTESNRTGWRGFAAGALAGLIVSALAAGASYTLLASNFDSAGDASRLAALESQAGRETATLASLEKRLTALESAAGGPDRRLSALEAANAESAPKISAAAVAAQRLASEVAGLRADIDAARGEIPGLASRIAKLEALPPPATNGAAGDLSALADRVGKIEAALAAPKSDAPKSDRRVAAESPSAADNAAAIAIVAGAIDDRLASGEPFAPELADLKRLGVDPAGLASLEALVNGGPTNGALAASFERAAPKVLAAATSEGEKAGPLDRFLAHVRNLVQVRDLNETAGDDPQALVSQIEAASRRGDITAALAAFGKLPDAARQAAGDWSSEARARQAADAALQSIREAAIDRLAGGAKP